MEGKCLSGKKREDHLKLPFLNTIKNKIYLSHRVAVVHFKMSYRHISFACSQGRKQMGQGGLTTAPSS